MCMEWTFVDLFSKDDHGKFNFDQSNVVNPETGEKVSFDSIVNIHY